MRNPYVIGPYVTGQKHYGRQDTVDYLLHGAGPAYWVVGNRRTGKTSLLRQLELLARGGERYLPLFWDMQGCDTFKQLGQYLSDAANECGDAFVALGLTAAQLNEEDALALLPRLRRAVRKSGRDLLLLCDETEVLIKIARAAPKSMQRLHGELTGGNGLRVVATSTQAIYQMHDVCRNWPTSPFLAGFDISQTLGSLAPEAARQLITQAQEAEPVRAKSDVVEAIAAATNQHPYLMQLLCSRLFEERGWLRAPADGDLAVDEGLQGFLAIDVHLLAEADRNILAAVHDEQPMGLDALQRRLGGSAAELRQRVHNLERLGYVRQAAGQVSVGNRFLSSWLDAEPAALSLAAAPVSEPAMQAAIERKQMEEAGFLRARLNAARGRLIELDAVRARDLLDVSPQVLAEIDQLQGQIKHLRRLVEEMQAMAT